MVKGFVLLMVLAVVGVIFSVARLLRERSLGNLLLSIGALLVFAAVLYLVFSYTRLLSGDF